MNHDCIHCFDFRDDICPDSCQMARLERDLDGTGNDVSPVFLSYMHFKGEKDCPVSCICTIEDLKWKCPHHDVDNGCYGGLIDGKCPFMKGE